MRPLPLAMVPALARPPRGSAEREPVRDEDFLRQNDVLALTATGNTGRNFSRRSYEFPKRGFLPAPIEFARMCRDRTSDVLLRTSVIQVTKLIPPELANRSAGQSAGQWRFISEKP